MFIGEFKINTGNFFFSFFVKTKQNKITYVKYYSHQKSHIVFKIVWEAIGFSWCMINSTQIFQVRMKVKAGSTPCVGT